MYAHRLAKDNYSNRLDNIIICIYDRSLVFAPEIADMSACSWVSYAHSSLSGYSARRSTRSTGYRSLRAEKTTRLSSASISYSIASPTL